MSLPSVYLGVLPSSRVGVAIANYTAKLSRMWAWDSMTLKVFGYQDVKARVELLDVSADGEHVGYSATALHKTQSYLAVSRPPYFHALLLRNGNYIIRRRILFARNNMLYFERDRFEDTQWLHNVEERTQRRCPFQIAELKLEKHCGDIEPKPIAEAMTDNEERCGVAFQPKNEFPFLDTATRSLWRGQDCQSREIWSDGYYVYADDLPFLDLTRQPFTEVVPPEWAKSWTAPRPK